MKANVTLLAFIAILSTRLGLAQDPRWKDDWKPSAANLAGQEYPRINSERRAQFRIKAPDAKEVSVNIGKPHTVTKIDDGVWTITISPLDECPNGVVTKIVRLASGRICRNPVGVILILPPSPKVGAGAPTLGFGPQPR